MTFPLTFIREVHQAALQAACEEWRDTTAMVGSLSWRLGLVVNDFQSRGLLPLDPLDLYAAESAELYIVATLRASDGTALRIVMTPADASVRETEDCRRVA